VDKNVDVEFIYTQTYTPCVEIKCQIDATVASIWHFISTY